MVDHGLLGVNDHSKNSHGGYPLCPLYNWKGRTRALENRLLWMISSFVFKALSFRLLRAAQAEVLLNSDWAVLRCLEPTRRLVSSANFIILLCGSIGCTCRSDATLTYDGDLLRTLNNTSN